MLEKILKKVKQNYFSTKNTCLLSSVKFDDIIDTINNNAKNEILDASNQTLSNDNVIRIYKQDNIYTLYLNKLTWVFHKRRLLLLWLIVIHVKDVVTSEVVVLK